MDVLGTHVSGEPYRPVQQSAGLPVALQGERQGWDADGEDDEGGGFGFGEEEAGWRSWREGGHQVWRVVFVWVGS